MTRSSATVIDANRTPLSGRQKLNRHRFQTLPACDLVNLASLIGIIYVESV